MSKIIGRGAFGIVYNRLPFENENLEDIKDLNEVTKIYFNKDILERDFQVLSIIKKYLNNDEIQELINYVVLPKKKEKLNFKFLNKKDKYQSQILINIFPRQAITFDKGTQVALSIMNIQNFNDFKINIMKTNNLIKGLSFFENKKLFHCDIKPDNIIEIDNTFKFIDLTGFGHYHDNYDCVLDARVMMYCFWNPSCIFQIKGFNYNYSDLVKDLYLFYEENKLSYNYFLEFMFKSFNLIEDLGFIKEELGIVFSIYGKILLQRCFLNYNKYNNYIRNKIIKFITSKDLTSIINLKSVFKDDQTAFIENISLYLKTQSPIQIKKYVLARNDRYGISMCLLYNISKIITIYSQKKITFNNEQKKYLIQLYQIIEMLSCPENNNLISLDIVLEKIKELSN